MSPCLIDPFVIKKHSSLSITIFVSKSPFYVINVATLAFFQFPFAWNTLCQFLHFQSGYVLTFNVSLLQAACRWHWLFCPFRNSFFWLGNFSPFKVKLNIDRYVLIAILLIVYWLFWWFLFSPFFIYSLWFDDFL